MTDETISLFLGSALGSISKLVGTMVTASINMNKAQVEGMVQNKRQQMTVTTRQLPVEVSGLVGL